MKYQSTFTRAVAGVLAAIFVVAPAGTSMALCLSADHGGSAGNALPSEQVVVHHSQDCCTGEIIIDTDSAFQLDPRRVPVVEEHLLDQGGSSESVSEISPKKSSWQSRAPPQHREPTTFTSSLRTVVLLV